MSYRRLILSSGLLILVAIGAIREIKKFPSFDGGLEIPQNIELEISGVKLKPEEVEQLRTHFAGLRAHRQRMFGNPDLKIKGMTGEDTRAQFYSIWVKEKFILDGYFVGHSTVGLQPDQSNGFRLDRDTVKFLNRFLNANAQ